MIFLKEISLYIHIPFCKKKCLYCDFPSFSECENVFDDYVSSLVLEIKEVSGQMENHKIQSIFIGGGTPTVLPPKFLGKILDTVFNRFDVDINAEITVEANSGTVDSKYFRELKAMNVNRLSFGVQAWQNSLLKTLGRIHDNETFVRNFHQAREEGFKNINCDLMFSLPTQTLNQWEETLEKIMNLSPEHISAYSLIIEEGTPFQKMFKPIDDTLDRQMYYLAKEMLKDRGYLQYEISNFSKENFKSCHNIVYWQTKEYLGLGLGAHSYNEGMRFHNTYNMEDYIRAKGSIKKLQEDIDVLSDKAKIEEFMFMGLRMTEGISTIEFKKRFGEDYFSFYNNETKFLLDEKLITINNDKSRIFLTPKGIDISNLVFEKFIKGS